MKEPGRILCLDLGEKTIGLAVSDPSRRIATSLGTILRKNRKHDLEQLRRTVEEWEVTEIVVGNPVHLSGRESEGSKRSRGFARLLEEEFKLPVRLVDESLSTKEAEAILKEAELSRKKRKKHVDGLAAAIVLQSYLRELAEKR